MIFFTILAILSAQEPCLTLIGNAMATHASGLPKGGIRKHRETRQERFATPKGVPHKERAAPLGVLRKERFATPKGVLRKERSATILVYSFKAKE